MTPHSSLRGVNFYVRNLGFSTGESPLSQRTCYVREPLEAVWAGIAALQKAADVLQFASPEDVQLLFSTVAFAWCNPSIVRAKRLSSLR